MNAAKRRASSSERCSWYVVTEFSRLARPMVNRPGPALKVGSPSTRAEKECDLVSLAMVIAYATDQKSGTNGGGSINAFTPVQDALGGPEQNEATAPATAFSGLIARL